MNQIVCHVVFDRVFLINFDLSSKLFIASLSVFGEFFTIFLTYFFTKMISSSKF
jgi:hypothetical protein